MQKCSHAICIYVHMRSKQHPSFQVSSDFYLKSSLPWLIRIKILKREMSLADIIMWPADGTLVVICSWWHFLFTRLLSCYIYNPIPHTTSREGRVGAGGVHQAAAGGARGQAPPRRVLRGEGAVRHGHGRRRGRQRGVHQQVTWWVPLGFTVVVH